MAHRLGSLVPVTPARQFRPGVGANSAANVWEDIFTATAPPTGTTKFLILHFVGVMLNPGDSLSVPLGNGDTDVFTSASGPDFWTRPIKGGTVAIRFADGGSGAGTAPLAAFGRGEGIVRDGQDGFADISLSGGNANGDIFMLDTPYVDPPHVNSGNVCPANTAPHVMGVADARDWVNVETLPAGVMRDAARSTGMFVEVGEGKVSTCSAALIAPDLILTAGHCVGTTAVASGSFTLDFQTDAAGNRPAGYNPKFYKMKRLVKFGFTSGTTGGSAQNGGLDYAIVQIETPPGGQATLRVTPEDRYGNVLGPGRADEFTVSGTVGSVPNEPVEDRGDGSYDIGVLWDPAISPQPGVVLSQPGRSPVTLSPGGETSGPKLGCPTWLCVVLAVLLIVALVWIVLR